MHSFFDALEAFVPSLRPDSNLSWRKTWGLTCSPDDLQQKLGLFTFLSSRDRLQNSRWVSPSRLECGRWW
jgi:hypothetical protein